MENEQIEKIIENLSEKFGIDLLDEKNSEAGGKLLFELAKANLFTASRSVDATDERFDEENIYFYNSIIENGILKEELEKYPEENLIILDYLTDLEKEEIVDIILTEQKKTEKIRKENIQNKIEQELQIKKKLDEYKEKIGFIGHEDYDENGEKFLKITQKKESGFYAIGSAYVDEILCNFEKKDYNKYIRKASFEETNNINLFKSYIYLDFDKIKTDKLTIDNKNKLIREKESGKIIEGCKIFNRSLEHDYSNKEVDSIGLLKKDESGCSFTFNADKIKYLPADKNGDILIKINELENNYKEYTSFLTPNICFLSEADDLQNTIRINKNMILKNSKNETKNFMGEKIKTCTTKIVTDRKGEILNNIIKKPEEKIIIYPMYMGESQTKEIQKYARLYDIKDAGEEEKKQTKKIKRNKGFKI